MKIVPNTSAVMNAAGSQVQESSGVTCLPVRDDVRTSHKVHLLQHL